MEACTFFGHRDCPSSIEPKVREVIVHLITAYGVQNFYVGNQGQFDAIVRRTLNALKKEYPQIHYAVVLAYMPAKKDRYEDYSDTLVPAGIEHVYPRYAISWRNRWMLQRSKYVITYIDHSWGGAAKYARSAAFQKKVIFDLTRWENSKP